MSIRAGLGLSGFAIGASEQEGGLGYARPGRICDYSLQRSGCRLRRELKAGMRIPVMSISLPG